MRKAKVVIYGVLVTILAIGLVFGTYVTNIEAAQMKRTVWRMQTCASPALLTTKIAMRLSEKVLERTDGKLKIEVYHSAGLGYPGSKLISVVRDGVIETAEILGSTNSGEFPLCNAMEQYGLMPWYPDAPEKSVELRQKVVDEVICPRFGKIFPEKYNCRYLGGWMNDPMTIGLHDKKAQTLDDLKGLKIRVKGATDAAMFKQLGMAPVAIPASEAYQALSTGVVDGISTVNTWLAAAKFYEVLKYCYTPLPTGCLNQWIVNKQAFDALPPDVQKIVREEMKYAIEWANTLLTDDIIKAEQIMKKHGVQYFHPSPGDRNKFVQLSQPLLEKYIKEAGPEAREIVDAIKQKVAEWEAQHHR